MDSIARRCSREQRSQKYLARPRSTAVVQVSGGSSLPLTVPQKSQVTNEERLVRLGVTGPQARIDYSSLMRRITWPASRLAGLLAFMVGAIAAPIIPPGSPVARETPAHAVTVVALGDSVTSGTACNCAAYPQVFARLLSRASGPDTRVANFGVPGLGSAGLLERLRHNTAGVSDAVGAADIVMVTIGANDFADLHDEVTEGRCEDSPGPDCVSDALVRLRDTLTRILVEIRTLRGGQQRTVLVTGYWNDFEDGAVASERFPDNGLAATADLTRRTNEAVERAARDEQATYVDLAGPFHRRGTDVTDLLAADGDHPNAAGHRLIAQLLVLDGLSRHPAA